MTQAISRVVKTNIVTSFWSMKRLEKLQWHPNISLRLCICVCSCKYGVCVCLCVTSYELRDRVTELRDSVSRWWENSHLFCFALNFPLPFTGHVIIISWISFLLLLFLLPFHHIVKRSLKQKCNLKNNNSLINNTAPDVSRIGLDLEEHQTKLFSLSNMKRFES